MKPKLSIVFVNYNSADSLRHALESLSRTQGKVLTEAIVVDNGSRDRSGVVELCRQFGARALTLMHNLGYGAAANRGARLARADYIAVANPDIVFQAGSIPALVRFLDEDPSAGVAGPRLEYPDGTFHPSARRFPRLRYILAGRRSPLLRLWPGYPRAREFLYLGDEDSSAPVRVESIVGTFMVFRRRAFEEIGGFDERFFMYAEDIDICRRLSGNWGVYMLPGASVMHAVGQSRRRSRLRSEYHRLRSHRLFFQDGAGEGRRLLLEALFAAYVALFFACRLVGLHEHEYSWARGSKSA